MIVITKLCVMNNRDFLKFTLGIIVMYSFLSLVHSFIGELEIITSVLGG